jgi:hypothetical protein
MFGPNVDACAETPAGPDEQRGLVPRVLEYLFAHVAREERRNGGRVRYLCRCSFYEIFNERVFDLLDAGCSLGGLQVGGCGGREGGAKEGGRSRLCWIVVCGMSTGSRLRVWIHWGETKNNTKTNQAREDMKKGVYVEGLTEEAVDSPHQAYQVLTRGYRNRHVGETAMNRYVRRLVVRVCACLCVCQCARMPCRIREEGREGNGDGWRGRQILTMKHNPTFSHAPPPPKHAPL